MPPISENSRRIAKNTVLLYFRMLLLMFIGLFTSRVVLKALGVEDYGVYGAVGGLVMLFTVVTNSVSQSISRYITWHLGVRYRQTAVGTPENLGKSRPDLCPPDAANRLHRVFSTAVVMQLLFCVLLLILTETLGLWWLNGHMNIPADRYGAAHWVLQCSMGVLMVNLLSVPFNATIISHERMDVFAWISIAEALLKLGVALLLVLSPADKLVTYAVLMLGVAVLVRMAYGITCRRLFPETRGRMVFDGKLLKEMTAFAGWNVLGSGAYIVNTQGINQLVNIFFGVALNGARLVATQVENIIKQFVSNFLTALNPQITKSYAAGDKSYSFELVNKGIKFSGLILTLIGIPLVLEAPTLLRLWLGDVPDFAVSFTRLTVLCILADMLFNPLVTLIQADGRVKGYYLVSSAVALLAFAASWIAFKAGAPAEISYLFFAAVYFVVDVIKVLYARKLSGYSAERLFEEALGPVVAVAILASALPLSLHFIVHAPGWRLLAVFAVTVLFFPEFCWRYALTSGEREFVLRKTGRWLPDALYLRMKYRVTMGCGLRLWFPQTFTEKLQWQKLHDRNPLYHKLVDKAEVKAYVASKIGEEHVIPMLGVWTRPEDIDWDALPEQFVLKCTHDSGSSIICIDKASFDRAAASARLSEALRDNFWLMAREWAYKGVRPRIIAEPYVGASLSDYKIFCFRGKPEFLFVATDRDNPLEETKFDFFTPDWRHLDIRNGHPNAPVPPGRPAELDEILRLASVLSEDFPQVRMDFYAPGDGRVLFGEYTFCHWGGFVPFDPPEADLELGSKFKLRK